MKLRQLSAGTVLRIWVLVGVIAPAPFVAALSFKDFFFAPSVMPAELDPLWGAYGTVRYFTGQFLELWSAIAAASLVFLFVGLWLGTRIVAIKFIAQEVALEPSASERLVA